MFSRNLSTGRKPVSVPDSSYLREARRRLSDLIAIRLFTVTVVLVFLVASCMPLMAQRTVSAYVGDTTSYFEGGVSGVPTDSLTAHLLVNGNGAFSITSTPGCGPSTTQCYIYANFKPDAEGQYEAIFTITAGSGTVFPFHRIGLAFCKPGSGCVTAIKPPVFFIKTRSAVWGVRG
jgi:hypothetical protein